MNRKMGISLGMEPKFNAYKFKRRSQPNAVVIVKFTENTVHNQQLVWLTTKRLSKNILS